MDLQGYVLNGTALTETKGLQFNFFFFLSEADGGFFFT